MAGTCEGGKRIVHQLCVVSWAADDMEGASLSMMSWPAYRTNAESADPSRATGACARARVVAASRASMVHVILRISAPTSVRSCAQRGAFLRRARRGPCVPQSIYCARFEACGTARSTRVLGSLIVSAREHMAPQGGDDRTMRRRSTNGTSASPRVTPMTSLASIW